MDYGEFTRNIAKAGLSIKEFAYLIKTNPNSITNLSKKKLMPKNLSIIAVLLGEMKDKGVGYNHLFDKMILQPQKPRVERSFGKKKNSSNVQNITI